MPAISVRLRVPVDALNVSRGDGLPFKFKFTGDTTIAVADAPETNDEFRKEITAQASIDVTGEVFDVLRDHALAVQKAGPSSDWSDEDVLRMIVPPPEVRATLRPASQRLAKAADVVVRMLRWRFHAPGPPARGGSFAFSVDGSPPWCLWFEVGKLPFSRRADAVPATLDKLETDLLDGVKAPLGWELYYEALDLQTAAPRAAFVIAFTAAEVGIKQFGGRRSASEKWLLDNIQSPSMSDMLSHYLPTFVHVRVEKTSSDNKEQCVPDAVRKVLNDAVNKRNKTVHSPRGFESEYQPSKDDLQQLLWAVGDLLYLLDWFTGSHPWARDYLSEETRTAFAPHTDPKQAPKIAG
jgi:hypothetical protein